MIAVLLLFLQAPAIEELRSEKAEAADCTLMKVSQTGKYLLLARPEKIEIFSADDLKPVKTFDMTWTTVGFDVDDQHLVVVGKDLVRIRPKDWSEVSRAALPDAEFRELKKGLRPRQAWMYPDGSVLYRTKGGGIRQADWDAGKLVTNVILDPQQGDRFIYGIIGMTPMRLILDLGPKAGILIGTDVYHLVLSSRVFFAENCSGQTVMVGTESECTYNSNTWRLVAARVDDQDDRAVSQANYIRAVEGNRYAAAIDPKSGWVLIAGDKGLRAVDSQDLRKLQRYPEVTGHCWQLTVDGPHRLLYTIEPGKIRSWKLKE
jgi:hypothetical protein